ncbi:unnamed protein product [Adineta ricciae]|uniref:BED-type domain-containing protein n=1 Tax=Adineta ricciae TaxID=249248 RepID=A0A815S7H4_ADIRI|nr:unnamed protein product [Adineta ricciae]
MAHKRRSLSSRSIPTPATTTAILPSFDDDFDEDQAESENISSVLPEAMDDGSNSNITTAVVPEDRSINTANKSDDTNLRSNVWAYAKKISKEKALCACKIYIKTPNGSTSTLRKHLIQKHNLIHLQPPSNPRTRTNSSISRDKKNRLDHLAYMAIFEDGRTFGDLRKNGMSKFLNEAVSENANDEAHDDDDDEENRDLVTDSWDQEVNTGDNSDMSTDVNDEDRHVAIIKMKLAAAIQKGRSLIKLVKRSQIITMFIDNEKKLAKIKRRLYIDCMTRWNSTLVALQSLVDHKPVLISLFETKDNYHLLPSKKKNWVYWNYRAMTTRSLTY